MIYLIIILTTSQQLNQVIKTRTLIQLSLQPTTRLINRLEGVRPALGAKGTPSRRAYARDRPPASGSSTQANAGDKGESVKGAYKGVHSQMPGVTTAPRWTHANIRQYTFSQDSAQLQQARHSVWRDNHVLTTTPPSQGTALAGIDTSHPPTCRTLTGATTKTTKATETTNRKRMRARPSSHSLSTTSSVLSPMLDEDTATEEETIDLYDNMFTDVHTNETVTTPVHITTDAVYMYGCTPKRKGNSSPIREPDGIG